MSKLESLLTDINTQLVRFISENCDINVPADKLSLDRRAGMLIVSHNCIIVNKDRAGSLEYYGGFEYVDKGSKHSIGDYVIYTDEDSRVSDCLNFYYQIDPPEQPLAAWLSELDEEMIRSDV